MSWPDLSPAAANITLRERLHVYLTLIWAYLGTNIQLTTLFQGLHQIRFAQIYMQKDGERYVILKFSAKIDRI